jgi:hypothetical protein
VDSIYLTEYETDDAAALTEDRRRSRRVEQLVPAWISGDASDRSAPGRQVLVTDLSLHGVGFRDAEAETEYRVGSRHWIVVNGGQLRISTRMRIVSCRESPEGGFEVGAAFY